MGADVRRAPGALLQARAFASALVHPRTLDRYMVTELVGPFTFGLSAFTLIFASTTILAIGRLISEEHAPFVAAVAYFLWQMPQIVVTVVPAAMLLGTLLVLQRLSSESEITAFKAGGIGLLRIAAPLLVAGFVVSLVVLLLQEGVVPFANNRATSIRDETIRHVGAFGAGSHTVTTQLPGGGEQVTYFRGFDQASQSLLFVTIVTYGTDHRPKGVIFSDRGRFDPPTWRFENARAYHFTSGGDTQMTDYPEATVDIGEKPSEIQQLTADNNRETMSRSQIREIIASGQLSPQEVRAYQSTYEEKLARPFASLVFTLIAVPFGLRPARGGGSTGLGFGLALTIVFVYFVIASASAAISAVLPGGLLVSTVGAWLPNVIFTLIGFVFLGRAARH